VIPFFAFAPVVRRVVWLALRNITADCRGNTEPEQIGAGRPRSLREAMYQFAIAYDDRFSRPTG
jgi:hypothetical protein